MGPFDRIPPSRRGKKQIMAFLLPNQLRAAYAKALSEAKTNQEIIGEALNAIFVSNNMDPLIPPGHFRIVRRNRGQAEERQLGEGKPGCRAGRYAYGGWFEQAIVDRVVDFSATSGLSVQSLVEQGIELITLVTPDKFASESSSEVDDAVKEEQTHPQLKGKPQDTKDGEHEDELIIDDSPET
jgi:hypothetical protein